MTPATEWDLLHELAHLVTSARPGISQAQPKGSARQRHGDAWTENYILLVEDVCGKRPARRLAAAIQPDRRA